VVLDKNHLKLWRFIALATTADWHFRRALLARTCSTEGVFLLISAV
jgi:hypothetical protein